MGLAAAATAQRALADTNSQLNYPVEDNLDILSGSDQSEPEADDLQSRIYVENIFHYYFLHRIGYHGSGMQARSFNSAIGRYPDE